VQPLMYRFMLEVCNLQHYITVKEFLEKDVGFSLGTMTYDSLKRVIAQLLGCKFWSFLLLMADWQISCFRKFPAGICASIAGPQLFDGCIGYMLGVLCVL
jgi:hypothetical protein